MAFDSLDKIRKDSDNAITQVPSYAGNVPDLSFQMQPAGAFEDGSITGASSPLIPMYITVPGFTRSVVANFKDIPGTGFDVTFMMLINPDTLNCGTTGNTQAHYTRKGFVTQLWGLNFDTLTSNGKTAAFWVSNQGLTNNRRSYSAGLLNFMALLNAFKNNGYRLVDRTNLNTIEMATRVIDVVHGVQINYDGNLIMGHFNTFSLDEDAEHPYLLTYNFEFIVSAYGSTNGMNEIYGHYLRTTDNLATNTYKVRVLADLDGYFTNTALVDPDPNKIAIINENAVKNLWTEKTGQTWDVAIAHGWDQTPDWLYYSLKDPESFDLLTSALRTPGSVKFSSSLTPDVQKVMNDTAGTLGIDSLVYAKTSIFEMGGKFNFDAKNPNSTALGPIQLTDVAARDIFGKTSAQLLAMYPTYESYSANVTVPYFQHQAKIYGPIVTQQQLCMAIFYPAAMNWDLDRPFPPKVQAKNPGIRTPRDYINKVNLIAVLPTTDPPPAAGDNPDEIAQNSASGGISQATVNGAYHPLKFTD